MRSDHESFKPLGEKVEKPTTAKPEWLPTGTPGIERNQQGQLRNVTPPPPSPPQTYIYGGFFR